MRIDVEVNGELIEVEVISPEDAEVEILVVEDDVVDRLTDSDWGVLEDEVLKVLTMMRQEQEQGEEWNTARNQ